MKKWLWSSPKALLHLATALALFCFFLALVFIKSDTLRAVETPSYSAHFLHSFFPFPSSPPQLRTGLPPLAPSKHPKDEPAFAKQNADEESMAPTFIARTEIKKEGSGNSKEDEETMAHAPLQHDNTDAYVGAEKTLPPAQKEEDKSIFPPLLDMKGDINVQAQAVVDDQEAESDHLQTPFTGLGPKIADWDQQRQAWLSQNPELAHAHEGKLNILLVTSSSPKACDNPYADYYLRKFFKNKLDYCRLHSMEFFYSMAQFDRGMNGSWSKLPLLRKLMLTHPEMEWIWWMDNDAVFTDMLFDLPMERYKQHNLVLHGWGDEVYIKKSWIGLNAGVFLIRNCQWSLSFMDAWARMGANQKAREEAGKVLSETLTDRPLFEADDQSALVYLLTTEKNLWESKVFLEYSYYLHGYWETIVGSYEELMKSSHPGYGDERWPFVTHFVGCRPCKSLAEDKCLQQMEKAFNFGDNQVLQYYGFRHTNLGSIKVERILNETSQSLNKTTNPSMAGDGK